jgi:protocatechuate 4,5-dioxygenase alpha subunit
MAGFDPAIARRIPRDNAPPPICRSLLVAVQTVNHPWEAALDDVISGAYVFTGERSARSYALNKMANSLSRPDNRTKFQADEAGYMRGLGCSDTEIELVKHRDWKAMMEHGASIYLLLKIGAAVGVPLPEIGAHTAGMTLAEYHARKAN